MIGILGKVQKKEERRKKKEERRKKKKKTTLRGFASQPKKA